MDRPSVRTHAALLLLVLLLLISAPLQVTALWFSRPSAPAPHVLDFSKNTLLPQPIPFCREDFQVSTEDVPDLSLITLSSLPDARLGTLTMGDQPLTVGTQIQVSALDGLRFVPLPGAAAGSASFTFRSDFGAIRGKRQTTVSLYLLEQENLPPIARNLELETYRNVPITGRLQAQDREGDTLSYRVISTPSRGSVTVLEDGSGQFIYTPYENKTGTDSFSFVVCDTAGNTSPEAHVTLRISKPSTSVTYADLSGHPAHKAAIHLAEAEVYVGPCLDGQYFFHPEQPVTRAQFLTMAMAATGYGPLAEVSLTGFSDDADIPDWAKGSVAAALKAGMIQGSRSRSGAPVFQPQAPISGGEAAVMLDRMLRVADVPAQVFSPAAEEHWAAQSAANLSASGVTAALPCSTALLSQPLCLADAARMLDGALSLTEARTHW